MRVALLILALVLATGCDMPSASILPTGTPAVASTDQSSPPPAALPTTRPTPMPRLQSAILVLDAAVGTETTELGILTPPPNICCGVPKTRGPSSFSVDPDGRIWLVDVGKGRLVVYEGGRLTRSVPLRLPSFVLPVGLLVWSDVAYLKDATGGIEYEIDLTTGETRRSARRSQGDASIYPRDRPIFPEFPRLQDKGDHESLGSDAMGNVYDRELRAPGEPCGRTIVVRRVDAAGDLTDFVCTSSGTLSIRPADVFIADDGAVFEMEWLNVENKPTRVVVNRLLAAPTP